MLFPVLPILFSYFYFFFRLFSIFSGNKSPLQLCFPFSVVPQGITGFYTPWVQFEGGRWNFQGCFCLQGLVARFSAPSVSVSTFSRHFLLHSCINSLLLLRPLCTYAHISVLRGQQLHWVICTALLWSTSFHFCLAVNFFQNFSRHFSRGASPSAVGWAVAAALGLSGTGCDGPKAAPVSPHHALPSSKAPTYIHI